MSIKNNLGKPYEKLVRLSNHGALFFQIAYTMVVTLRYMSVTSVTTFLKIVPNTDLHVLFV